MHDGGRPVVVTLAGTQARRAAGLLVLEPSSHRPWDGGYREFVGLVASAIGTALANALAREAEMHEARRVGEALQLAMLPTVDEHLAVTARYLPAVGSLAVGGDWYDVVALEGGRVAVVVGDCVGSGIEAAAVMGQLRSAGRALLLEDRGPAEVLDGLDRFACSMVGAGSATVLCAILDRAAGTLTYSSAGHLPPLVSGPGGPRWLDAATAPPLGVRPGGRPEATVRLHDGDTLVLYTDGLVERRGESLDVGFARLAAAVGSIADGQSPEELADELVAELVPGGGHDDVALLVYRHRSVR
jgi:serine phosphatase RsbU (regulator of sigma subunit)